MEDEFESAGGFFGVLFDETEEERERLRQHARALSPEALADLLAFVERRGAEGDAEAAEVLREVRAERGLP